tara:strand:- start:118 stop:1008 length:891 start_codon:yes stop_codon:yes gene_type:complete
MISVIVPSYNSSRTIRQCIETLLAQRIKDYEIIIVDDKSTDDSIDIAKEYPRIKIVSLPENGGPSIARNSGVRESAGDILIFLDIDCFVKDPAWISKHVEKLKAGTLKSIIGGAVNADGPGLIGKAFTYNNWYVCHPKLPSLPRGVSHLQSTNISMYRSTFEHLGGFDESLRAGEDVEFCVRAVRQGYSLEYYNHILVYHDNRTFFRQFLGVNFDYGKTRLSMKKKGVYGKAGFVIQENPIINILFMLPLTILLTLRIIFVWLPYDIKALLYSPFIFLGQLMMVFGVFYSLIQRHE